MNSDLLKKLFVAFDAEHRVILATIRAYVGALEPGAPASDRVVSLDEAFRMAHSLKGAARVVDLLSVVTLAHRLESLFSLVREGKLQLGPESLPVIYTVVDAIEDLVAISSQDGRKPPAPPEVLSALDALIAGQSAGKRTVPVAEAPVPSLPFAAVSPAPGSAPEETLRLKVKHLDGLLQSAGELVGLLRGAEQVDQGLDPVRRSLIKIERELQLLRRQSGMSMQQMQLAVEFRPVARFIDLLEQELKLATRSLGVLSDQGHQSNRNLKLLSQRLEQDVLLARMIPAEGVFEGFSKMVRDLSSEEGKKIEFRATGLEVEADRAVLQSMKDPLMHMIRNCISHGLETPSERNSLQKNPLGRIRLEIQSGSGRLRIILQDDGRGMSAEKIAEIAVRRGLVTKDEVASLTRQEIFQFIFETGFSTAEKVTELSGRGLGMSVVQETVKRLQGAILVESTAGQGTQFTIDVPIAISSHRLILVQAGAHRLGIPCYGVERLCKARATEFTTIEGRNSFLFDSGPVPVVALASLLGQKDAAVSAESDEISLVILKAGDRHLAVAVDAILDEREALIQELGEPLKHLAHLAGTIHLADASIALVLDPAELFKRGHQSGFRESRLKIAEISTPFESMVVRKNRVLVVDDSITTRTLEKGILESHGYEVSLAVDGVEALEIMRSANFDVVISDVEMPRMDGFDLVEAIRKNPRFSGIPVIMVTSRENREDMERGLSLGANAYLAKQKFDQAKLLETIKQVI